MKKHTTEELESAVSKESFNILRQISTATHLLTRDIEKGFNVLAMALAPMRDVKPEQADRMCEESVRFIIGITDEVRHHIITRLCDLNERVTRPDMDKMTAQADYEKRLASVPTTISTMIEEVKKMQRSEPDDDTVMIVPPDKAVEILRTIISSLKKE